MLSHRSIYGSHRWDGDLVSLTIRLTRRQRTHLQALACQQGCDLSTILQALIDEVTGPETTEGTDWLPDNEQAPDHSGDPEGRAIMLRQAAHVRRISRARCADSRSWTSPTPAGHFEGECHDELQDLPQHWRGTRW